VSRPGGRRQLVVCGLGGQGILFVSGVLASAAMLDGDEVLMAESHGMSQRGGAVEAHLKLGGFASSLVRRGSADAVLVLDPSRLEAALPLLGPDGICFANTTRAEPDIQAIDASGEARSLDHPRGQNLILLGYAATRAPGLLPTREALEASLEKASREAAREPNRVAFERGVTLAAAD
jgi:indolepyruvate ferredoxin oxidoreductase beta subunit